MSANVLLIGPRASGKSTVGRLLAARRSMPFVDLDEIVLAAFDGLTPQEIWDTLGEQAWRNQETTALEKVLAGSGQVVALGGGVPCIEAAQRMIADARSWGASIVIYLRTDADELVRRLRASAIDRPSLTGRGTVQEVPDIVRMREPTYVAMADFILDMPNATAEEMTMRIEDLVFGRGEEAV